MPDEADALPAHTYIDSSVRPWGTPADALLDVAHAVDFDGSATGWLRLGFEDFRGVMWTCVLPPMSAEILATDILAHLTAVRTERP